MTNKELLEYATKLEMEYAEKGTGDLYREIHRVTRELVERGILYCTPLARKRMGLPS